MSIRRSFKGNLNFPNFLPPDNFLCNALLDKRWPNLHRRLNLHENELNKHNVYNLFLKNCCSKYRPTRNLCTALNREGFALIVLQKAFQSRLCMKVSRLVVEIVKWPLIQRKKEFVKNLHSKLRGNLWGSMGRPCSISYQSSVL